MKAKRLLLYAAERLGFAWLQEIDPGIVDLDAGPRSIHAGGRLNTRCNLIINEPESY